MSVEPPMNGMSALMREPQRAPCPFHPARTWEYEHRATCGPGGGPHQTPNVPHLELELPASRTVRNKRVCL